MLGAFLQSASAWLFWIVLLAHLALSLVAGVVIHTHFPHRYQHPKKSVIGLIFLFSFILPVLGAVGLWWVTRATFRTIQASQRLAVPQLIEMPIFDVQTKESIQVGQGSLRSKLNHAAPPEVRMQSLLTLQAVPNRTANPILENLLSDDADDVRLVAFGMLDSQEKSISQQIRHELDRLGDGDIPPSQRFDCFRQLAQLNWELVYSGLAQGGLRKHIIGQSLHYVTEALALCPILNRPPDAGLLFLQGRIALDEKNIDEAQRCINEAVKAGYSPSSAAMLLAEVAFLHTDIEQVIHIMQDVATKNYTARARAVRDYWLQTDTKSFIREREIITHL